MAQTKPMTSNATLSLEEEQQLSRRWMQKSDARALATLIHAHLGLVIKIATEFRNSGPSMEDLIQEGHVGLTIAARRFDPSKATRLATYATYWIRACMMEYVVRSHGPVRIGTTRSQRKIFFGLGRARRRLEREGRQVSSDQLALLLGVPTEDVEHMSTRLSGHDVSLDAPRSTDDERRQSNLLAGDGPSQEDLYADGQEDDARKTMLNEALKQLDPRERAILKARHMSARPITLGALGKRFGISRERVRQLELRAVAKLRTYCSGGVIDARHAFHPAEDDGVRAAA
jgi:RNA polymerase sigma-32 factor